jgi:hypothetical protein
VIVEERIYVIKPDCYETFLDLYENEGMAIQLKYLPRLLGYFVTEIGVQFQVIHMWGYEDFAERDRCRTAMRADPAWQAYVKKVRPLFASQETRIMRPMPWSPIR